MAFIFLALAFSMAIATFVESSYGTPTARALIYNTHWFELLWALFAFNLLNNLFKYRFFTTRRITLGLFHVSFLVMILANSGNATWISLRMPSMVFLLSMADSNFCLKRLKRSRTCPRISLFKTNTGKTWYFLKPILIFAWSGNYTIFFKFYNFYYPCRSNLFIWL